MVTIAGAPIVVGVDGSESAITATVLAAHLAARRRRPLVVVHAFIWPELHVPLGPSPAGPPEGGLAHQAEQFVADAVAAAVKAVPDLAITGRVVAGAAAPVLLEQAERAAMLVLGDRGLGGFTGLLVGSVAIQAAAHARCPVVVARGDTDRTADVLVGVDGSPSGAAAVDFAFEEAALRRVGLMALHAYDYPTPPGADEYLPLIYDADQLAESEAALLAEAIAGRRDRFPEVPQHPVVTRDRSARALIRASQRASLVVVGSRGRGGFIGLVLGSVSHALIHHAACPVAIVR